MVKVTSRCPGLTGARFLSFNLMLTATLCMATILQMREAKMQTLQQIIMKTNNEKCFRNINLKV